MMVSIGATANDMVLRNRDDIWSGPLALLGFRPSSSLRTPFSVTVISGAVVYGDSPRSGILLESSLVNTEENWLLRISAFYFGDECSVRPSRRGVSQCHQTSYN